MVTAAKAVMTNHKLHNHNNNNNDTTTNSFAATPLPTPKFNGLSLSAVSDIEKLAQKAGNNACCILPFLSNPLPNVHWGGCALCVRFSECSHGEILSFWVSLAGPVLVLALHLFPWRILLGILGVF
jgi:hypothetical protein